MTKQILGVSLEKPNKEIQEFLEDTQKELSRFFGISVGQPVLFFLNSRKEIDFIWNKKTEGWMVAWAKENYIFILNPKVYTKESDHKDIKHFWQVLKHEYCHIYFKKITNVNYPKWLNEGLACYLANQIKPQPSPEEALKIFEYFSKSDSQIYKPAYFWTKLLIEKFGVEKMLSLIETIKSGITEKQFSANFYKIYGLHYSEKDFIKLL
jgi:hypothetical protein